MNPGAVWVMIASGALAMGYLVTALFFLQFWKQSRDRLFIIFSSAFALLAVQRVSVSVAGNWSENTVPLYLLRLFAYVLILAAVIDKNRAARG